MIYPIDYRMPSAGRNNQIPKVSVLMPTYNTAKFLREAIESILSQSFKDFQFVIIDDGSTDGSGCILSEYAEKDSRIKIIRNEQNRGIVFSLNQGLKECQGKYVVRMDSDDIALKERLQKQIAIMDKNPNIIALGAAVSYIDRKGNELGVLRRCAIDKSLIRQNPMLHPTMVFRRATLVRYGLCYLEKYRYAEDYFLVLQLSRFGKLFALDDIVLKYRLSNSAIRIRNLKMVLWATLKVKINGIFGLKIKPSFTDILRIFLESILLLLPSSTVRWIYLKITFKKNIKVKL